MCAISAPTIGTYGARYAPEVDLELLRTAVAVGDAYGGAVPAVAELGYAEAMERRIGELVSGVATQLVVDLDERASS